MRHNIAYIVHFPEDRVNDAALAGVWRYAKARGWDVEVFGWKEALKAFPRAPLERPRPVGLVVECGDIPPNLPRRFYGGLPAVFVNCPDAPARQRFARIFTDDAAVADIAFRELSAGQPSAVAVVGFRLGPRNWSDIRIRVFRDIAAKAGLDCRVFAFADPRRTDTSDEPARLAAWLAALPRHTGIFAVNDDTAADVAAAARAALLNIPRDLTLIGVDNDQIVCEASHPAISSIQMDFENMGYLAAKALGEMMATRSIAVGPLMAVRRESTMGRGRREPRILEAVEMIRREACDGLTAERLAKRFRESRRLFEMRFREAMGHSVLDEILHVRMQNVRMFLADTDTPVGTIADFCGFRTYRALHKLFFAREKMSMTEWRRLHRR